MSDTDQPMCEACLSEETPCDCPFIQPYAMSRYPGECMLVRAHPNNPESDGEQWYKRSEVDALFAQFANIEDLIFEYDDIGFGDGSQGLECEKVLDNEDQAVAAVTSLHTLLGHVAQLRRQKEGQREGN